MRHHPSFVILFLLAALLPSRSADVIAAAEAPEDRIWTYQGASMRAKLIDIGKTAVNVRMASDGWVTKFWLDQLSDGDQDYVRQWKERGFGPKAAPKAPQPKLNWPGELTPDLDFEAKLVSGDGGVWTYETPHYQYRSDVRLAPSLIKEYAVSFEGTLFAIRKLPLQLGVKVPAKKFVVRMFRNPGDYLRAGGLKGSSGTYLTRTEEILVPLSSTGVKLWGKQVALDRRTFDSAPLVHEITHQVMHDWVRVLPVWFVEGMAEYMAALPFNGIWYDFDQIDAGIREHMEQAYSVEATRAGVYPVDMVSPRELMTMSHEQWAEALKLGNATVNYSSALLMVYYFAHLDEKNAHSPLVGYLRKTQQGRDQRETFVADYNQAVEAYKIQLSAYNREVDAYNAALLAYGKEIGAYKERVRTYTAQVAKGVKPDLRIDVGPKPGNLPKRPQPPALPRILADNPQIDDVDLSEAEVEARAALLKGRTPEELWKAMEEAFAKERIWIREVSARS